MEHFFEHLPEILEHTLLDTLPLIPFLFLTYLFMEFLEHRSGNAAEKWLGRSGKIGPLMGGVLGILPQCGFSAAASGLYTGRMITTGTLIAVYLSTSDEMLPIMISSGAPAGDILTILGIKLGVAVAAGFAVDLVSRLLCKGHLAQKPQIEELCQRENCECGGNFVVSALKHTLRIGLFVLIFSFVLDGVIHTVGEETLAALILNRPFLGSLLASFVGLIPNCASSVVLTGLYLDGIIGLGALLAGLLVNAGVGLAILFRNNRPLKDSFRILLILWGIGAGVGILTELICMML